MLGFIKFIPLNFFFFFFVTKIIINFVFRCGQVKENVNGKKASIVEVKRAINQIIPHTDP